MPPSSSKANYKSYEAQARLLRAVVAAHPTVKWNYKEIAACYGSDMTEHALNHRFRHIRAQTEIIHEGRKFGLDIKNLIVDESSLPKTVGGVDKDNIAKYFGQSTADGIQFQFRSIKTDALRLKEEADKGGDPTSCLQLGNGAGPFVSSASATPKTPRSHNPQTPTTAGKSTITKRRANPSPFVKIESDVDGESSDQSRDWSELEATPSKRIKKEAATAAATPSRRKNGTPTRHAAARANATIASVSAHLLATSESEADTATVPAQSPTVTNGAAARPATSTLAFATSGGGGIGAASAGPAGHAQTSLFHDVPRQPTFHSAAPASASNHGQQQESTHSDWQTYFGGPERETTSASRSAAYWRDDEGFDGEF